MPLPPSIFTRYDSVWLFINHRNEENLIMSSCEWFNDLKAIPKIEFEKCFKDWQKLWHKCIVSYGDYFEGDNINVDE
jgi:hypothetical protein